jgi:hypothetical protein
VSRATDASERGLPLVLAGPILRRVEPPRVVVWLATSRRARVRLEVRGGGGEGELLGAGTAESVQVGRRLFVHLVAAVPRADSFPAGELLGYDVEVMPDSGEGGGRLAELGLLDDPGTIAYPGLRLPTFFLAPTDDASLGILHGSCRLLHGEGEDAMLCADELLAAHAHDVARRARALFLTGDQIYADDVAGPLVGHVRHMATELVGPADERSMPGCPPLSQVPLGGRTELAAERARLTGPNVDNHLLTFGEFAAMYLTAWNERTWPERLPSADEALGVGNSPRALRARRRYEQQARNLAQARSALPATRRVLANVPTYMIFDDHDVTDDWNLTAEWREAVAASPTGRRFVANALAAYWLFQGWGNDPDSYDDALKGTVAGFLAGDPEVSAAAFEERLWSFDRWSYVAPTTPPAVVLDTRTQRSYDSERGAARLIGAGEQRRVLQLAREARANGRGDPQSPLVLVSAVPVYGLELQERRQKFLADKVGPYEIDFEAWHSNLQGLVDFMRMLAEDPTPPWCLLLSGDVHYGCNVQAGFWVGSRSLPLVQLVSSSLKHSGRLSRAGIELLGRIVSRQHERLGWDRPPRIGDRIAERVVAKAANTDTWNPDAPVFLAPKLARAIRIEQPPDYRETRLYVPPDGDGSGSMLLAANNIGHVTLRENELTHRLLARTRAGTRAYAATMPTGHDVLAALNGRRGPA